MEHLTDRDLLEHIARDDVESAHEKVLSQRAAWQRACRIWMSANLARDNDVIRFIATERLEESTENVAWQRDNWRHRCANWLTENAPTDWGLASPAAQAEILNRPDARERVDRVMEARGQTEVPPIAGKP